MSEKIKKTVKIKENDLVNLIDNLINEAVELKKQEWLNEQATAESEAKKLFEERLSTLEKTIEKLSK